MNFRCPKCKTSLRISPAKFGTLVRCPKCAHVGRTPAAEHVPLEKHPFDSRRIIFGSFLFGGLAAGALAGMNYARIGQEHKRIPAILVGGVAFLLQILLFGILLPQVPGPAACLVSAGIGWLFAKEQEPDVVQWRHRHGLEKKPSTSPALGRCLLVGIACLVVEFAIAAGVVWAIS